MHDVNNANGAFENINQVELQNQPDTYLQTQLNKLRTDQYINSEKQIERSRDDLHKQIRSLSDEDCKSLVYVDNVLYGNGHLNIDLDISSYRAILISKFNQLQSPIEYYTSLVMYKINNHLPEAKLKWLKDDLRSAIFMYYVVLDPSKNKALRGEEELVNEVVKYFKYEIISFNCKQFLRLPRWSKKRTVDNTYLIGRFEGVKLYYLNNRIKDKSIGWLDPNNSAQINWAYAYITDDKRWHIILDGSFFPVSDRDKYNLILASLDILNDDSYEGCDVINDEIVVNQKKTESKTLGLSARDYVLTTMKNAWDKYSSSNSNDSGNEFKIYQKNKEKIDALASADSTSPNKLLNKVIVEAYDEKFKK